VTTPSKTRIFALAQNAFEVVVTLRLDGGDISQCVGASLHIYEMPKNAWAFCCHFFYYHLHDDNKN